MHYHNFDLSITASTNETYPLAAFSEQMGEAHSQMSPESIQAIQSCLQKLDNWNTNEDFLIEFGTLLYESLFVSDIESLFQISCGVLMQTEEEGLRIRLRINSPEISVIPWEYLYSPKQQYFLGASQRTPLVRYLDVFQPILALEARLPLKALFVIPRGSGLDTQREKSVITEALRQLGDKVQPTFLEGKITISIVADALVEERYQIFHFIGHGTFINNRGYLLFNDEQGEPKPISDETFSRLFLNQPAMKLIVLNACMGAKVSSSKPMVGMAPKLVGRGIPAVIAHQYSVSDEAAIRFSREFYRSLCAGSEAGHVDAAMAYARNQLSMHFPADPSFGAPVLFMRSPDGLIFNFGDRAGLSPEPLPGDEQKKRSSDDCRYLESLLTTHERNQRVLEQQIAQLGAFAPPYMRTQLEDEKAAIDDIRQKLRRCFILTRQ
jgi:hypothetical protein